MSPQARVARMSDEALAAEIDRLLPDVLASLLQGSEAEQTFAQAVSGKTHADLIPHQQHQLLAFIQVKLAQPE
jgi:hypothetical protein